MIQSYTLNGGDATARNAACKKAFGSGKYVLSLAVLQFSADATNELKKKLIANLQAEASANANLKAAVFNADGTLQVGVEKESDTVVKIAAAKISRILLLGFGSF